MITTEQYARALNRAHAEHITIVGSFASAGRTTWQVENPAHADVWYAVVQHGDGPLTCSCEAGVRGRVCKHVALVQEAQRTPAPTRRTVGQLRAERQAECLWL